MASGGKAQTKKEQTVLIVFQLIAGHSVQPGVVSLYEKLDLSKKDIEKAL